MCERATRTQTQILKGRKHKTNPKDQRLNVRVHKECLLVEQRPPMLHSLLHLQGVKHYHISLTKVVEMMWMQKNLGFSMHLVYHSMFFAHHIGMKCYKSSMVPLKDTGALGMTKLEPWDLTRKEPKS